MNNKERKYYWIMILVIILYLVLIYSFSNVSELSTIITTITALIAAVSFWMQLKRTENLDEANFIMSLNDQFISNDEMTRIEHALELYYHNSLIKDGEGTLELVLERDHNDCQRLINYLVYMEGLAALIQRNVMHLGVIDDLFAYRFFIAVNNPIVQKFELLPYANYYQGCFVLSELWTTQWRKEHRDIPLDQYALFECDNRLMNVYRENNDGIVIRYATESDDFLAIAKCIYLTDPFIYPAAFGYDWNQASHAISSLLQISDGLFHFKNILIAVEKNELCGILLYNKSGATWNLDEILVSVNDYISCVENLSYVSKQYFELVAETPKPNSIEIVACCVMPHCRNKGIGEKMLKRINQEFSDYNLNLNVLENNKAAVNLYKKCGFEIMEEYKGFSMNEETRPDCLKMVKRREL